jgi:glucose-1-phosphate thymidylyltransferase
MKGIILAGGTGSRLHPITLGISKQLMPIYDKPMIYYPLSTLISSGIKDILIITTPDDLEGFQKLLKDGSQYGINISYVIQPSPDGLAQAFILGDKFIGDNSVALVLGDNIFYGERMDDQLDALNSIEGGLVFGYKVSNPKEYGVVEFDKNGKVLSLEEKPESPKSSFAVPGLYFYDSSVIEVAKNLKPSKRGELEITDLNRVYLETGKLRVNLLPKGTVWLDTGTFESMSQASDYIRAVELRQGTLISSPEVNSWRMGFINDDQLAKLAEPLVKSGYGKQILSLLDR